jgi:hypothetical protein
MQNAKKLISVILIASLTSGCATTIVLQRPPKRKLDILTVGTARGAVVSEFGEPAYSHDVGGEKMDTYSFDEGISGGSKFVRGFFHIVADLCTIFLWELIAWPAEQTAAKKNTTVEVTYDKDEKIKTVHFVKK